MKKINIIGIPEHHKLIDVDFDVDGAWVGMTGLDQGRWSKADKIIYPGGEMQLSREFFHPTIRILDTERVLIVVAGKDDSEKNAFVMSRNANFEVISEFYAGKAIKDVLITRNFIVITYFDEGLFSDCDISQEGIAVFDLAGNYMFGNYSRPSGNSVDICDCYAACSGEDDSIYFCSYEDFPLVKWDLQSGDQQITEIPDVLNGPSSMTVSGSRVFFHSSYKQKGTIFEFRDGAAVALRNDDNYLKTKERGRFIRIDDAGFSVIDCTEL